MYIYIPDCPENPPACWAVCLLAAARLSASACWAAATCAAVGWAGKLGAGKLGAGKLGAGKLGADVCWEVGQLLKLLFWDNLSNSIKIELQFKDWICWTLNISIWVEVNLDRITFSWLVVKFCIKSFGIFCICATLIFFNNTLGNVWINDIILESLSKLFNPIPEKLLVFPNLSNKVNISPGEKVFNVLWSIFTICKGVNAFNWEGNNLLINAWKFVLSGLILPNLVEGNENLSNTVANWISVNKLIIVWSNCSNLSGVICNSDWHILGNASFICLLLNLLKKFDKPLIL